MPKEIRVVARLAAQRPGSKDPSRKWNRATKDGANKMRFLCISDIHGKADALRQVLAEAEHWSYDQLLVCGDLCFPGPEPLEVWKMLVERNALCVQGLSDKALS